MLGISTARKNNLRQERVTPDEVGKTATGAGVKTGMLTHLPAAADLKTIAIAHGEQVEKQFSGHGLIAGTVVVGWLEGLSRNPPLRHRSSAGGLPRRKSDLA
jgi:hypothetical protein